MKGDNNAINGTGVEDSDVARALSSSSKEISTKWYVRLDGTRKPFALEYRDQPAR